MADKEKKEVKRFKTPVFRLSFPSLFVARKHEDGEGPAKFSATGIWTPSKFTANEKVLWQAIIKELHAVSMRDFKKKWNELPDNVKRGLRDGAAKEGTEGYGEGTRFANMTTHVRPGVVGNKKGDDDKFLPISPEEGNEHDIYPGCYCRATVNVYTYGLKKGSKGKGVAIGLYNIQKVKDGERLDNRVKAEDDFDDDIDAEWMDDADDGDGGGDDDMDFDD